MASQYSDLHVEGTATYGEPCLQNLRPLFPHGFGFEAKDRPSVRAGLAEFRRLAGSAMDFFGQP